MMGTIFFAGQPIGQATSIKLGERSRGYAFGAESPGPRTFNFTATFGGAGAFKALDALRPVDTPAVKMVVPWGILGRIDVRGWVDGSTIKQDEHGTIATLDVVPDEHALQRALAIAVEQAIVNRSRRGKVCLRAFSDDRADVYDLARAVFRKRGERKERKAMRRLLRAAGVTTGGGR